MTRSGKKAAARLLRVASGSHNSGPFVLPAGSNDDGGSRGSGGGARHRSWLCGCAATMGRALGSICGAMNDAHAKFGARGGFLHVQTYNVHQHMRRPIACTAGVGGVGGARAGPALPPGEVVRSIARANVTGPVRHPEGSLVTRRYALQASDGGVLRVLEELFEV